MRKLNLLFCGIVILAVCTEAWRTRRKINVDDLTKEDLDKFLESIISRRENDAAINSCVSDFEETSGVILRTHDSIANGAKFILAPKDVTTEIECKTECCNTLTKNTTHCDFAVFQQHDDDPSDNQPQCFLFSCFLPNGTNLCVTSPNSDYKVLQRKPKVAEKQLIDVATEFPDADKIETIKQKKCSSQFTKKIGTIIRTKESIKNGAEFLQSPKSIETIDQCQLKCCDTLSDKTSRRCDYVIFHQKADDSETDQPSCFLFSCTDDEGKFRCLTSAKSDYVALKRTLDIDENQLVDIATSLSLKTETPVTKSTLVDATKSTTTSTTSTTSTTKKAEETKSPADIKSCGRLDWQCDDGACVRVTDVCNGKPDCRDKSDENGCEVLDLHDTKSEDANIEKASTKKVLPTSLSNAPSATVSALSTSTILTTTISTTSKKEEVHDDLEFEAVGEKTGPQKGAVLPLALGLSVTACVLLMVGCRLHIMKKKMRRRGKPLSMEESDYLINGMYL